MNISTQYIKKVTLMNIFNKFWYSSSILFKFVSAILLPLSLIWIIIDRLKFYFTKSYNPSIKTICVGNINVGGTGKTPVSIFLYKILKKMGYKPVFLSYAYKSKLKKPTLILDNLPILEDEAKILNKTGDTVVSNSRLKGIKFIENLSSKKNYDIIIMDDGLQNYSIKKHLSFLTIDRGMMFGNGLCLPSGPLRQYFNTCSKNIDAIIFTGDEYKRVSIKEFKKKKFHCITKLNLKGLSVINKKYFAFSGLAYNLKFFNSLIRKNINICRTKEFNDHYLYKDEDIVELIDISDKYKLKLITTEKDFVKIPKKFHSKIKYVPIEIDINENELIDLKLFLEKSLNG